MSFKVTAGTTLYEQLTGDSVTVVFSGPALREAGGTLWLGLTALVDPASGVPFSLDTLSQVFEAALRTVEADITVKRTRGTGFAPSLAIGGDIEIGIKVGAEAQVGGTWLLTVTETTQRWRLANDRARSGGPLALFQLSDHAFEETEASEQTITEIVSNMLSNAATDALSGTTIGDWMLAEFESGDEATVSTSSERTETAQLTLERVERSIADEVGETLDQIELAIRIWGPELLPDFIIPGSSGRLGARGGTTTIAQQPQGEAPAFFASEFVDVAPFGVTVGPPARLALSYLATPENPQDLRLYRYEGGGVWRPLPTTIDAERRVATAEVSEFGTFVVGFDIEPPEIVAGQTQAGFTAVVGDTGSGVDAASIALTVNGEPVALDYDAILGVITPQSPIADGTTVVVTVADTAGNIATLEAVVEVLPIEDTALAVDLTAPPVEDAPVAGEETPATTTAPGSVAESTPTPSVLSASEDGGSSGGGGSLLITVVLVVLAAAGGGGLYLYRRRNAP